MHTPEISNAITSHPKPVADKLAYLRGLIHQTAEEVADVKSVEESLKWGQPSFAPVPKKTGSSVRLDKKDDGVSLYFICTTSLVEDFKELYPDTFNYVGNREIHFKMDDEIDADALKHCIAMTLTYKLKDK